jgi:hypothetical protein
MSERWIERGWESYRRVVVDQHASDMQIAELRQAYFSGAAVLFETITRTLDPGDEATEADMERMDDLLAELTEFGQQLDTRYLTGGHG